MVPLADQPPVGRSHPGAARGAIDALLGVLAGIAVATALQFGTGLGIAVGAALVTVPFILLKPGGLFWLFLLGILVFEEFPSGEGETVTRSIRNPFYGQSIGIPGMYMPDLLVGAVLLLAMLSILIQRHPTGLRMDRILLWLLAMSALAAFSGLLSFIKENPLAYGVIQETAGTGFEVNERGAQLIAFFQFKNFVLLVLAYLAAQFHLRDTAAIQRFLKVMAIATVFWLAIGLFRLATHPEWVAQTLPLFYDSQSSWLFALVVFYVLTAWALDRLPSHHLPIAIVACAFLMLFILVSFRRTMWAAILLGAVILMVWLPSEKRNRLLVVGSLLAALGGIALLLSPAGELIFKALATRVEQTDTQDTSTVYRLALFLHFAKSFHEIPLFGYGVRPLWNEFVQLGYFRMNLENVHSLYFWLLLRMGYAGFITFLLGMAMILAHAWKLSRTANDPTHRMLALMVLLGLVMFLFSGIFNPVYAQPRYMVALGVGLALLSNIASMQTCQSGARR